MVRNQESNQNMEGERMIETIRTFFGKVRGQHENKRTIVVEGELWRCTKCKMIFLNKQAGEQHECSERL
jgi:predicted nucleotidyltransferase